MRSHIGIWSDRGLQERLEQLDELERELKNAQSSERRERLDRLNKLRGELFPEALVARLKAELIAFS